MSEPTAPSEELTVEPVTFYTTDGGTWTANTPGEINRLRLSRTHFETAEEAADPAATDDTRFHPEAHNVDEVLAYLEENPVDGERVLAEERTGKARQGILGE